MKDAKALAAIGGDSILPRPAYGNAVVLVGRLPGSFLICQIADHFAGNGYCARWAHKDRDAIPHFNDRRALRDKATPRHLGINFKSRPHAAW